jgi:hypothetical protein
VVLLKLGERLATPAPPTPPTPVLQLSEDIRKLAESNPTAKGLVDMVEALMRTDADKATQLREQIITTKLGEFDRSGLALTPVAKDLMHDIAIKMDDADLGTKFWELMTMMRDAQGVMVELGERGRSGSQYMREKSPTIQFDEEVQRLVTGAEKVALPDAMERVAKENPALYAAYRNDTYIAGGSVSNNG